MQLTDFHTLITGEGKKIRLWDFRQALDKPAQEFIPSGFHKADLPESWYKGKTVTGCTKLVYAPEHDIIVANFTGANGVFTFDLRASRARDYYNYHYYSISDFSKGDSFLSHIAISAGATQKL